MQVRLNETISSLFLLLLYGALVAGILYMLVRAWGECKTDTAFAKERLGWPTTTVRASLFDTSVRRVGKRSGVIGHFGYEFGDSEHVAETYETTHTLRVDAEAAARALKEQGKTIDLEVQYDPDNPADVSDKIVTSVPTCRYWIGGFLVFCSMLMALILRGFFKIILGLVR